MSFTLTAWLHWNAPKIFYTLPLLDRPITWYGVLFVLGYALGYFILIPIFTQFLEQHHARSLKPTLQEVPSTFPKNIISAKQESYFLADRLTWFIVIGTLVGARLGHILFYDWELFKIHPTEIFKVWNGGLASHGGTIGVFVSLFLFTKYAQKWVSYLDFLSLMDCVVIPTSLAVGFIRLGNFVNQEILGIPTTMPWGIIFENPADGSSIVPRHPVQLYEALSYFAIFLLLYTLWKKGRAKIGSGFVSGLLFLLVFSSRFFIEFWKERQPSILDDLSLQVGQILSIPFIIFGISLIWKSRVSSRSTEQIRKTN